MQLSSAVIVQYVSKYFRVPVEKVLLVLLVVEEVLLVGPQQGVRVLLQRVGPGLEPETLKMYVYQGSKGIRRWPIN